MSTTVIPPPDLISDRDRGFRIWSINEIYVPGGQGRYVPNVGDFIIDPVNGFYRVISVDYATGVSIRAQWTLPTGGEEEQEDILLGSGPGTISESFRVWLNPTVTPHTLSLDRRLHLHGTAARSIKIFRGSDVSLVTGEVISAYYDQSGNYLGQDIPLELVGRNDLTNFAIKAPAVGYTSYDLADNERVTAVVYDDAGQAVSRHNLLVVRSAFTRRTSDSDVYIRDISLRSPFIAASDPQTLQFPINMPVQNLNLMGVVEYSDGTSLEIPVDGTKFVLHGLNEYVATVQGQRINLVLTYNLSQGEHSPLVNDVMGGHISVPYYAETMAMDGAYSIKLFAVPVWTGQLSGYRMEYYLYNLLRDRFYNVTNLVQVATGSLAFDPLLYGSVQTIAVAVNMQQVDPRFANYRHVQTFRIALMREGTDTTGTNWWVSYNHGQGGAYGEGTWATARFESVNNYTMNLASGCTTLTEWLDKVYWPLHPLFDEQTEARAPEPNFVILRVGHHEVEIPVSMWDRDITVHEAPEPGKPVYLHFIRRNAATDLQLAVGGMITRYIA